MTSAWQPQIPTRLLPSNLCPTDPSGGRSGPHQGSPPAWGPGLNPHTPLQGLNLASSSGPGRPYGPGTSFPLPEIRTAPGGPVEHVDSGAASASGRLRNAPSSAGAEGAKWSSPTPTRLEERQPQQEVVPRKAPCPPGRALPDHLLSCKLFQAPLCTSPSRSSHKAGIHPQGRGWGWRLPSYKSRQLLGSLFCSHPLGSH